MGTDILMAFLSGVTLPGVFPEGVSPVLLMLPYMCHYPWCTTQIRSLVISSTSRKGRDVQPSASSAADSSSPFPTQGRPHPSAWTVAYMAGSAVPCAPSSLLMEANVLGSRGRVAWRASKHLDWSRPVKSEQMATLVLQKSSSSPCSSQVPQPVSAFQFSLQAFDSCSQGNCARVVSWG